jgi:hypothetical protein
LKLGEKVYQLLIIAAATGSLTTVGSSAAPALGISERMAETGTSAPVL